jgi:hypothetical protein
MCKSQTQIGTIQGNNENADNETVYVGRVDKHVKSSTHNQSWAVNLKISGKNLTVKLDTGAMANILSINSFHKLSLPNSTITPTKVILKSHTGNTLPILEKCNLNCEYNISSYKIEFYVVNDKTKSLLGLQSCIALDILQRNEADIQAINQVANTSNYKSLVDTFGEVFSGIGCIDPPYKIKLGNNADKLKQTVSSLENLQIIKKVEGPSEWVNPLVIVKKIDDSLIICLDPLHLNKAIKREHSKLLTFEDITC